MTVTDGPGGSTGSRPWPWVGIGLIVTSVIALAAWAWIAVPAAYPLPDAPNDAVRAAQESARLSAIATTRASVLAALAGLGALATILINYRNSQVAARTLAITQRTFAVQARGHLTDRYTKAIEQLGNTDSNAIRLGGIYALEQIAVDTDRDSDQRTVVEVLSAFIREHAAPPHPSDIPTSEDRDVGATPAKQSRSLASDVATAIAVLWRLPRRHAVPRADLNGADFTHLDLTRLRLSGANLTRANLSGAHLDHAYIPRANLSNANFTGSFLPGAVLHSARLRGALLIHAYLIRANLNGADFTGAHLRQATLTDAQLRLAILDGADLSKADLSGASLAGAQLNEADLTEADLRGVDLTGASLVGADLTNAHLTRAKLRGAQGLRREQLSEEQMRTAESLPAELDDAWPPPETSS